MSKTTKDGLTIYDLDPQASELWVVAGPAGYDISTLNADNLPDGFRWVTDHEWADLQDEGNAETKYNVTNAGGVVLNLDGPLSKCDALSLASEIEAEHDIDVNIVEVDA